MGGAAVAEIMGEPKPIGSLKDWAEQAGLNPRDSEVLGEYTRAMGEHSRQRAAWMGITVEELRGLPSGDEAKELERAARKRDQHRRAQGTATSLQGVEG